jgi:hypothetical protein
MDITEQSNISDMIGTSPHPWPSSEDVLLAENRREGTDVRVG